MFVAKFFAFAICLTSFIFEETVSLRIYSPENDHNILDCEHPFSCGEIQVSIKYPFRAKGDPKGCGMSRYEVSCEHNHALLSFGSELKKYYYIDQDSINYSSRKVRLLDPGLQENNCSSLPLYSFPSYSLIHSLQVPMDSISLIFVSCKTPVTSNLYLDTAPCLTAEEFSDHRSNESSSYSYVVVGKNLVASDIKETCSIYRIITSRFQSLDVGRTRNISFQDIHNAMLLGFELELPIGPICSLTSIPACLQLLVPLGGQLLSTAIIARAIIGILLFSIFLVYKWKRRHLSIYDKIEEFLRTRNNMIPISYSYKQIKKMTNNFKEKLGEGGYGSVYKGKLRSGQLVAIKMLSTSKANGQDFINEVATLGRIHHVNVVRLVGFCATASKRALVYEYMVNGSLDKFIFAESPNGVPMNWKKSFEITTGVARGIEYLHQGCDMQILHFDIKPHNILLDENFVPKVSDFGLAKLCSAQDGRLATLTAVRGTLGYMAPELFYKKIGRVSYKADVYSFGMLLMDMAGRRRHANSAAEHSSKIDFPSWVYDKIDQREDMEFGVITEDEDMIAKKLILIALWCIQMSPIDRPSMRDVLKMLEGDVEGLQLPPKPQFYPPDSPRLMQTSTCSSSDSSTESLCTSVGSEME